MCITIAYLLSGSNLISVNSYIINPHGVSRNNPNIALVDYLALLRVGMEEAAGGSSPSTSIQCH